MQTRKNRHPTMRNTTLLILLLAFTLATLSGCYYTTRDKDGVTRHISHSEYQALQKKGPAQQPRWSGQTLP